MENPSYHAVLVRLFTYKGIHYDRGHEFSEDDLRRLTEEDVLNYFKHRCYGTTNPNYGDRNLRLLFRVQTVEYWKKSISKFYSDTRLTNISQGVSVTKFLRIAKRLEVRGKGQVSTARRPFHHQEFSHVIQMLKQDVRGGTHIRKYGVPAMLCFQYSLICRFDDAAQMMAANLQYNDRFPQYGLKVRLVWSKNVNDERDAPWQTIFGSVATTFCVLINVGIWLELNLSTTPGGDLSPYIFHNGDQ